MIDNALHAVAGELNAYLVKRFKVQEDKAIINTILNQDGSIPEYCMNKVILSLINLEHNSAAQRNPVYLQNKESAEQVNQPYNFNIDLLVTALFADYHEGLKFLSETIYFFHGKPVFNHTNSPGLDPLIQQLSFELIRLTYHEAHSLWGALGAKYMPSIPFKIRMLSFQSNAIVDSIPVITASSPTTQPK